MHQFRRSLVSLRGFSKEILPLTNLRISIYNNGCGMSTMKNARTLEFQKRRSLRLLNNNRILTTMKAKHSEEFEKRRCLRNMSTQRAHRKETALHGSIEVKTSPTKEYLIVTLEDGSTLEFPSVWLRDNCQCSKCFNPTLNSRTIDWQNFDVDVKPTEVKVNGDVIDVVWSDHHEGSYGVDWLRSRSFTPENQRSWLDETYRPPKQPWGSKDFGAILKRFNFNDVINSDDHLLSWLEAMAKHGIAIIEGTPANKDQVRLVANRVAFIKKTHYGEEFEVRAKADTSNLAYLAIPLQIHTDLPYYEFKPGFIMLHCLTQAQGTGGANQITDCLNVSNILKVTDPETYEILTETMVEWNDIGEDLEGRFHSIYRAPCICLDRNGKFDRVNYSQQQRDSHFNIPLEKVVPWYRAHKKFTNLCHHPDNTVFFKTKPGDILTFDNVRMVHGRTGYDDTESNERHLVGAYLDWDVIYSKMRVLKKEKYQKDFL